MNKKLYPTNFSSIVTHSSKRQLKGMLPIILVLVALVNYIPLFSQQIPSRAVNDDTKQIVPKYTKDTELKMRQVASQTLKASSNSIWFEKNDGQFGNQEVLYGFRTA